MYRNITICSYILCVVVSLAVLISSVNADYVLKDRLSDRHNVNRRAGLRMCEASPRDCPGGFTKRSRQPQIHQEEESKPQDDEKLLRYLLFILQEEQRQRLPTSSPLDLYHVQSKLYPGYQRS